MGSLILCAYSTDTPGSDGGPRVRRLSRSRARLAAGRPRMFGEHLRSLSAIDAADEAHAERGRMAEADVAMISPGWFGGSWICAETSPRD